MAVTLCCVGINHAGPDYLYEQLAGFMRERITSGAWQSRTRIPSITSLAAEHQLAAVTVRKAVAVLVDEGLLITRPGRGTFVR